MDRTRQIVRTSLVSIGANTLLVVFKLVVGFATNSIAIILDGVNNLTDAGSSLITIVGTKLAERAPDKKHPLGYGRIEYITGVVISSLVLITGIASARESIMLIVHPQASSYTTVSLVIIVVAIFVKIFMGRYVKSRGEKYDSQALIASGADASFDAVLSFGTLVAAVVMMVWKVQLDGWLGTIIAVVIVKAGLDMLIDALNTIIGQRTDPELIKQIRACVREHEGVLGVYDIFVDSYGAERSVGSLHIEVHDDMKASQIDELTRMIMHDVYKTCGVVVTVGIYASNTATPEIRALKTQVQGVIENHPGVVGFHGFFVHDDQISFDLVMDFDHDSHQVLRDILDDLHQNMPAYQFEIQLDLDVSD
jgi:cation diffusion facilitator family transporter